MKRKHTFDVNSRLLLLVSLTISLFAAAALAEDRPPRANGAASGAVYVSSNQVSGNAVLIFRRAANGRLFSAGSAALGGRGTGGLLENQGAVVLSKGHDFLFVANAGGDSISSFRVAEDGGLTPVSTVPSGGDRPVSLTASEDFLYVVNAGSAGNISGFQIGVDGALSPLPNSTRPLSTTASETCKPPVVDLGDPNAQCSVAGPTTIRFSPNGDVLIVTERLTDVIDTWTVGRDGYATLATRFQEPVHSTPFGFAYAQRGRMVVANSFLDLPGLGAASSFIVGADGNLTLITSALGNGNASTCWMVITNDGRYAFVTQPVSHSMTSYRVHHDGSLTLLNAHAAFLGSNDPRDQDLDTNGQLLFTLSNRAGKISELVVGPDGSLTLIELTAASVPSGANGLAAF